MKSHRKIKYSCPFCGTECERRVNSVRTTLFGNPIIMYCCKNEYCGALICFNNTDCHSNPNATDRYFFRRYLGGDGDDNAE